MKKTKRDLPPLPPPPAPNILRKLKRGQEKRKEAKKSFHLFQKKQKVEQEQKKANEKQLKHLLSIRDLNKKVLKKAHQKRETIKDRESRKPGFIKKFLDHIEDLHEKREVKRKAFLVKHRKAEIHKIKSRNREHDQLVKARKVMQKALHKKRKEKNKAVREKRKALQQEKKEHRKKQEALHAEHKKLQAEKKAMPPVDQKQIDEISKAIRAVSKPEPKKWFSSRKKPEAPLQKPLDPLQEAIYTTMKAIAKLELDNAKKSYLVALQLYNKLSDQEKEHYYEDIKSLYEDRQHAEKAFKN